MQAKSGLVFVKSIASAELTILVTAARDNSVRTDGHYVL